MHTEQGAALYLHADAALSDALLRPMAHALGLSMATAAGGRSRGEVEVFVSPPGHITEWHWDNMVCRAHLGGVAAGRNSGEAM